MRWACLPVAAAALLLGSAGAAERRGGGLRMRRHLALLSRRSASGAGPESPENTAGFAVTQPTPEPHPLGGTFCEGIACRFRRPRWLGSTVTTTLLPGQENVAAGIGSPYFCRGLGCTTGITQWRDAASNTFASACQLLLKNHVTGSFAPSGGTSVVSGGAAGDPFETMCKAKYPAERIFCADYGDVLTGAAAAAGLAPGAAVDQACLTTVSFLASAKQAEVDLELWMGSLPANADDAPASTAADAAAGVVPQVATMYVLAPAADDGTMPAVEVRGDLFQGCVARFRAIMGSHSRTGPGYVLETRRWCDQQANVASVAVPTASNQVPPGRPDWDRGRCVGMEQLVTYALRYDLDVTNTSNNIPEQEVCNRLFLSVGSLHRVETIVKEAIPLLPSNVMFQQPGPTTTPVPLALRPPGGPRLPLADDPDLQALLQATRKSYDESVQVFRQRYVATAAAAQARQEVANFAEGNALGVPQIGTAVGGAAAGAVAFPNMATFDVDSRERTTARLNRLRQVMHR